VAKAGDKRSTFTLPAKARAQIAASKRAAQKLEAVLRRHLGGAGHKLPEHIAAIFRTLAARRGVSESEHAYLQRMEQAARRAEEVRRAVEQAAALAEAAHKLDLNHEALAFCSGVLGRPHRFCKSLIGTARRRQSGCLRDDHSGHQ